MIEYEQKLFRPVPIKWSVQKLQRSLATRANKLYSPALFLINSDVQYHLLPFRSNTKNSFGHTVLGLFYFINK